MLSLSRLLCAALAAVAVAAPAAAAPLPIVRDDAPPGGGFLSRCAGLKGDAAKTRCYQRGLLAEIERSRDPAKEVPLIDGRARSAGSFLAGGCHGLMHWVGRTYARRHHLTLASLQRYLPRSSSPSCSAGFAHGMIMQLAPQIVRAGPKGVLRTCTSLGTRVRRYTCVHGLGHAYMRLYGHLAYALAQCRALGTTAAPDCAQGVFHDYWISIAGRDGARREAGATASPRKLCGRQRREFVRGCWYRTFLEDPPVRPLRTTGDVLRTCSGLDGLQRGGCVSAVSVALGVSDAFTHTRLCARLPERDVVDCLRGVSVVDVAMYRSSQRQLIRLCGAIDRPAQEGCYEWFGKALAVVTDGAFRNGGCAGLPGPGRTACAAGLDEMDAPLVTFA